MAFLWLLSCFAFIGASYGSRDPASEPELSIVPRIINGKDAGSSSSPWHVSLENSSGKLICGGSLINRNWVITAARCRVRVYDWVVAGLHDRRAYGNKIQFLKIGKIFRYPEFNISTFYGDFALLKLITQVNFQRTVSAIALPSVDDRFSAGSQCKIVGWGHTRRHGYRSCTLVLLSEVVVVVVGEQG
ncbi:chymotrypsinogen B-like [Talpa occidentalis]|uniref:chymotrypsinogen B-like n=1 Tax=Talpa occidentalis TaxID=50954 RepID=UPI0023F806F0|nr:chymotrypsinogen B-like [Talpa occidentalis]